MKKYGSAEDQKIIGEEGEAQKTAAKNWTEEDAEELRDEMADLDPDPEK